MNYRETVEYILSIPLFAQKIGTENLASLLERLGNPQDKSKVIHINGKGACYDTDACRLSCRIVYITASCLDQ